MPDKRLMAAAAYVRKNHSCVDVGTDHGYLAVYLYEQGITGQIIACDINQKPLDAAKRTIEEHHLTGKIEVTLSDGLENIPSEQAEDILICGMGGELIMSIIMASDYTKSPDKRFILQPMTNVPYLRSALYQNGYVIIAETPVIDKNHRYTVMLCQYSGRAEEISTLFSIVGKISSHNSEAAKIYLRHQLEKQKKIAAGLQKSANRSALAADYGRLVEAIQLILEGKIDGDNQTDL